MKKLVYILVPFTFLSCGGNAEETEETAEDTTQTTENLVEEDEEEAPRKSPRVQNGGKIMGVIVDLDYGSPRVKGRTVWGDLVPYDEVWRAGADEVSAITFSDNVFFGGEEVNAGTYGMFIIPKAEGAWTFILNEEWSLDEHGVWGAYDYKAEKDVLRVDVKPEWMQESQEELSYSIDQDNNLVFAWETARLVIPIGPVDPA